MTRLATTLVLVMGVTACNKNAPKVPAPVAVMLTPAPPARLLIPVELPEPAPPEPAAPVEPELIRKAKPTDEEEAEKKD